MEFSMGLFVGIAIGVVGTIFIGFNNKTDADKHVELLNAKAKKDLQTLQQSRHQIAQINLKAQGVHHELKSKIRELASQD